MKCFAHERDRTLFLLSRVVMRSVLASYVKCECNELQFDLTAFGKPILSASEPPSLRFNLTHSRGAVALAVSRDREVGVDIEERERRVDYLGLAERYFAADEARHLAALPEAQRGDAFFAIWTLKEAYVKGIGRGLTFPRCVRVRPRCESADCDAAARRFRGVRLAVSSVRAGRTPLRRRGGGGQGSTIELRNWTGGICRIVVT